MAKLRFPKSTTDVKDPVSSTNGNPSLSDIRADTSVGLADVPPASAAPESKKAETKKPARKPEIVKTEARANLVPINVEDEIRRLAYLLAERRGFEPGHEAEDWLAAEREIRQRYRQQSA
jgi:Protein of unknown function (DUF2934)